MQNFNPFPNALLPKISFDMLIPPEWPDSLTLEMEHAVLNKE